MRYIFSKLTTTLLIAFSFLVAGQSIAFDFEGSSGVDVSGTKAGYETSSAQQSLPSIIGNIISTVLVYLGVFFLLLMIYAGFTWMISRGNSTEVETAKKTLQNAIIGLIIISMAYAITFYVMLMGDTI